MGKSGEITFVPIFIRGKPALNICDRKFREKSYSRFPTPIAQTPSFQVQNLVRPMNYCRLLRYRLHLRYRLPQRAVECLRDHKPAVHLRRSERARGHLTRPGPTQIKQLAISGESVKSRLHRPLGDQVASKRQCMTKKTIPDAALHNSARSDVYSACRPGNFWMSCVQTWTIIAGAKTTRLSILSRLKI